MLEVTAWLFSLEWIILSSIHALIRLALRFNVNLQHSLIVGSRRQYALFSVSSAPNRVKILEDASFATHDRVPDASF
ncbi:hypothetical protein [Dulcicalothrix desertica]|uniref:hypothetical protein n=1 Tax=Dulcicalothrix desertica TaxID=32056 RepID=UPI000F8EDD3A|nr:hypothetical protein [Dulcicalothrix desertica]